MDVYGFMDFWVYEFICLLIYGFNDLWVYGFIYLWF